MVGECRDLFSSSGLGVDTLPELGVAESARLVEVLDYVESLELFVALADELLDLALARTFS